jgi:hypothetical protein
VLLAAAQQVAKWTLPSFVCRDNVGVANLMSRTAMVEARCARLEGYVLLTDYTNQQEEHDTLFLDSEDSDRHLARGLNAVGAPLLLDQQQQQHNAAAELCERLQHHHPQQQQQRVVPHGLGSGLPNLGRRRLQQQQQLPRRLLMRHQQQQHDDDDVSMSEVAEDEEMEALDALDAAELGGAADPAAATAAAVRLCNGLQSLQARLLNSASTAGQPTPSTEVDLIDELGGLSSGINTGRMNIRIEGGSRGLGGLQIEGLAGNRNTGGWVVLDDADDGSVPQQRFPLGGQQQAMLLPGL